MKVKVLMMALLLTATIAATAQSGGKKGMDTAKRAEMQTKMMVDSLTLTDKQAEKVKEINLKYANKQKEVRSASSEGDHEQMKAAKKAIRTEQDAELKAVLTQAQYDRWQQIAVDKKQHRGKKEGKAKKGGQKLEKTGGSE